MDVVSTFLNVAISAASDVEASALPFDAGAVAPPVIVCGAAVRIVGEVSRESRVAIEAAS